MAWVNPAFAGSTDSGSNRMPAPLDPPLCSTKLNVPEACHASRTNTGPADPSSYPGCLRTFLISSRIPGVISAVPPAHCGG